MDNRKSFLKNWSVYSKTAGEPAVAWFEGTKYVFIEGWPMTIKTYSLLSLRTVFQGNARLKKAQWEDLHRETRELCAGLCLPLIADREAQGILDVFARVMEINNKSLYDNTVINAWIEKLEAKINE